MRTGGGDRRDWSGIEAAENSLDEVRRWVVWGVGEPPEGLEEAAEGNEVAETMVHARDPSWERETGRRWAVVVRADEDDVDALVQEEPSARGYAPYLVDGKTDEVPPEPMRGTLRSDVAPRRKVDQPRPYD